MTAPAAPSRPAAHPGRGRYSRGRVYWACQIAGWSAWYATNLGINLVGRPFDWKTALSLGVVAVGGLAGTHAFRTLVRRRAWTALPARRLVPVAAVAAVVIGGVVGPASVEVSFALDPEGAAAYHAQAAARVDAGELAPTYWLLPYALNAVNVMVYVTAWMLVYVGVHLARRAAEAEADRLRADRDRLHAEVELTAARMRALEYQLNPHFLFNALNTVRALVHTDTAEADRAVTALSGLLRRTLAAGRETTQPLRAELDLAQSYLDLEVLRFGARLNVRVDADPGLLDVPVPALLVQTLVENAVTHGVARVPGGGEVAVRVFWCPHPAGRGGGPGGATGDGGLCVRVENPAAEGESVGTGTGLANACERLALLYGDAATLEVGREGDRVVAEVRLPTRVPLARPFSAHALPARA